MIYSILSPMERRYRCLVKAIVSRLAIVFVVLSVFSCIGSVDPPREMVYFYVKNQCANGVQIELRRWNSVGQSVIYRTLYIASMDSLESRQTASCEMLSDRFPGYMFGDSACIVFIDGSRIYYRITDSTSHRNLLYLKNYERIYERVEAEDCAYIFTLTEADHQAAIEVCKE